MTDKILLVEDSQTYARAIVRKFEQIAPNIEFVTTHDYHTAKQILLERSGEIGMAVLDFFLPDAPNGEIIDLLQKYNIPIIVITASFSDDIQEHVWTRQVIDYVIKEGPHTLDYLVSLVLRIRSNHGIGILIVDDSRAARLHLRRLLEMHQFQVIEAENGEKALQKFREYKNIKLVLTDYHMPGMDGFELVKEIRKNHSMEQVAIIGISAYGCHKLSTKFIKYGANDFITKPFISEHLLCRINQNITVIEKFDFIRSLSYTDYLTKLKNRQYLFEAGNLLLENACRANIPVALAMVDIDFFKNINDEYGHIAGDLALSNLAEVLKGFFRKSDIIVRYGGEEFCIILFNVLPEKSVELFEKLRLKIEEKRLKVLDKKLSMSVSIGICCESNLNLSGMINDADTKLYYAKDNGRNQVCAAL